MPPLKLYKVFVSYSRHDEALVKPLAGLLDAASDDSTFLDVNSIRPGDLWREEIRAAIKESKVFILCWCCRGDGSQIIAEEMALALEDSCKRLVPVRLCDRQLPEQLSNRQWIDLRRKVVHDCDGPHEVDVLLDRGGGGLLFMLHPVAIIGAIWRKIAGRKSADSPRLDPVVAQLASVAEKYFKEIIR